MNYADEVRRQAEAAPRAALPAVTALLWRAYGGGKVTEAEAEALSVLIAERTASKDGLRGQSPNPRGTDPEGAKAEPRKLVEDPRRSVGFRPRTPESMVRRRRWATAGYLPPQIAALFTVGEGAVLAVIGREIATKGRCTLAMGHIAALAGVSVTTAKRALRQAALIGLVEIELRRVTGFRNDTNRVTLKSREWTSWLRLRLPRAVCPAVGGGGQFATSTNNRLESKGRQKGWGTPNRPAASANPHDRTASRIAGA